VEDNQQVAEGDLLARIDRRDYEVARDKAKADVAEAEAGLANVDAQIALQRSNVAQAEAERNAANAELAFARQESDRYQNLTRSGYGSAQRAQQANADRLQKEAMVARSTATVEVARRQLDVLTTARAKAEADLARAQAAVAAAELDLGHTEVRSPGAGAVGNRIVRPGQYVQAGTRLMTIVPTGAGLYVTANFKETQLAHMRVGMRAHLAVDALDGAEISGHVESLAPATGSRFALLPPENATGNFTKIVQRVPVRIALDADDPNLPRLRNGLSVTATIDTRDGGR
jgi:membrane fusion protein (multidrug efflux system)